MGRGSYHGGSTVIGPGGSYYRSDRQDGDAPKRADPELQAIMEEHDRLRALGMNPMSKVKRKPKRPKNQRSE